MSNNRRLLLGQSVTLIRKTNNMKEKKYQQATTVDDSEFRKFNQEQTPEYLKAIEEFLERRSDLIREINEDLTDIETEDNKHEHEILTHRSKHDDTIIPKIKITDENNENKNISTSINYELCQSSNINDSLQKNILPDVTTGDKTIREILPESTNENNDIVSDEQTKHLKLHKKIQSVNNNSSDEIQCKLSKKQRDQINDFIRNVSGESSSNEENFNTVKLSPSNDNNLKNQTTVIVAAHDNQEKEFCSYIPYIELNELNEFKSTEFPTFGWYCEWRESKWNDIKVNVRIIKPHIKRKSSNLLADEINALSTLRHSNILILMGFTLDTLNNILPIYELFHHSLFTHLHEMSQALSVRQIAHLIVQILEALSYAHQMNIIHTTLSSHCIMFQNASPIIKICGFDYSVGKNEIVKNDIGRNQWYQWLAPELLLQSYESKATATLDIYSVCAILWECCYLTVPWEKISSSQLSQIYSKWKMGLSISENFLPSKIYNILKSGLEINPEKRMSSINELLKKMKQLRKQITSENDFFLFTSTKVHLTETSPRKVTVKKYNLLKPEKKSNLSSTTTPSSKSISTIQSSSNNTDLSLPKNSKLTTNNEQKSEKETINSGNFNIKDVIAEYEKVILDLQKSLNFVNVDHNKILISDTRIKPASHRTAIIKIPISGLNEIPCPGKPDIEMSTSATQSTGQKVKIDELKEFFEKYYWREEQIKCLPKLQNTVLENIFQINGARKSVNLTNRKCTADDSLIIQETDTINSIKDLLSNVIDRECIIKTEQMNLNDETKSKILNNGILYKGHLNLGKKHIDFYPFIMSDSKGDGDDATLSQVFEISNYELEQISAQTLEKFQQLYNYYNCVLSKIKEVADINENCYTVSNCLNLNDNVIQSAQMPSSSTPTNNITMPTFKLYSVPESMNYWNTMLKIFTNSQLEDVYIDEDFSSENFQLVPYYEELVKKPFCDDFA